MNHEIKLGKLKAMASEVTVVPDYWIANYPGQHNCQQYCLDCCEKHIAGLEKGVHTPERDDRVEEPIPLSEEDKLSVVENPPHVDGGWGSEYDNLPVCSTCDAPLSGSLTDMAVSEELSHHLEVNEGSVLVASPRKAWELESVISNASCEHQASVELLIEKLSF